MKLVADKMFVKLLRWMRLFGIAVDDATQKDDDSLIRYVRRKKALLITADQQLSMRSKRRKFRVLLIKEKDLDHQLAFVIKTLNLKIRGMPAGICPICDTKLVRISSDKAREKVPANAFLSNRNFYFCKKCKKVYWHGTHWESIEKRRKRVISIIKAT